MAEPARELVVVSVWDAPTRWFHWINVLCVLVLMSLGLVLMYDDALGLSNEGKVLAKTLHVWVGYVFVVNLLWRFLWAFIGNRHARWRAMLPGGRGYLRALGHYTSSLLAGRPHSYQGHNPVGRIAIALLLALLAVQAASGLLLAGTDLYYPPLGHAFATRVAAPGVDPALLVPYQRDLLDPEAYRSLRALRAPFAETHELAFFVLAALVVAHVVGVVFTELWEGGTLVSAMFTGRKVLFSMPVDAEETAAAPGPRASPEDDRDREAAATPQAAGSSINRGN